MSGAVGGSGGQRAGSATAALAARPAVDGPSGSGRSAAAARFPPSEASGGGRTASAGATAGTGDRVERRGTVLACVACSLDAIRGAPRADTAVSGKVRVLPVLESGGLPAADSGDAVGPDGVSPAGQAGPARAGDARSMLGRLVSTLAGLVASGAPAGGSRGPPDDAASIPILGRATVLAPVVPGRTVLAGAGALVLVPNASLGLPAGTAVDLAWVGRPWSDPTAAGLLATATARPPPDLVTAPAEPTHPPEPSVTGNGGAGATPASLGDPDSWRARRDAGPAPGLHATAPEASVAASSGTAPAVPASTAQATTGLLEAGMTALARAMTLPAALAPADETAQEPEDDAGRGGKRKPDSDGRAALDITFSRLGAVRLDVRVERGVIALAVRGNLDLSAADRAALAEGFRRACEAAGLAGRVSVRGPAAVPGGKSMS